jgi:hypothetical protein
MSGGRRHRNDEENGPSHAVGYESSKKQDYYSLERNQCVCADARGVSQIAKAKPSSPLTRPTSKLGRASACTIDVAWTAKVVCTLDEVRPLMTKILPSGRLDELSCKLGRNAEATDFTSESQSPRDRGYCSASPDAAFAVPPASGCAALFWEKLRAELPLEILCGLRAPKPSRSQSPQILR